MPRTLALHASSREAEAHLTRSDEILGRLVRRIGPCRLAAAKRRDLYEGLARSIVFQQLNGTAAESILKRVLNLFPSGGFPSAEDLLAAPEDLLRKSGLSKAKTAAIKDLARKKVEGVIPTRREANGMTDDDLVERLTAIRGVGPWTVHMLLIFTLGREDVLPYTDYGVRKGFAITYDRLELPTPSELLEFGERWRPYRSFAAWYFWRALDTRGPE